jgi:hypothetical protein
VIVAHARLFCVPVLALAIAPAAALGSTGHSAWSACSLLTRPEASAALGTSLKSVTAKHTSTGAFTCNWIGAGSGLPVKSISIIAATDYGRARWLARRSLSPGPIAVKGLGTGAYIERDGHDVVVYAGSDYLEVAASVPKAVLLKLARSALLRLKKV